MKSTDPADYQDTPQPTAGMVKESHRPRAAGCGVSGDSCKVMLMSPLLREGMSMIAVASLDMAAWDALARAAGVPVCALLGGSIGPVPAQWRSMASR